MRTRTPESTSTTSPTQQNDDRIRETDGGGLYEKRPRRLSARARAHRDDGNPQEGFHHLLPPPQGGGAPCRGLKKETRTVPLELTTTIRRVSSSPKARSGLSPAAAAGRAVASIRYITRSTAAEAVEWSGARPTPWPRRATGRSRRHWRRPSRSARRRAANRAASSPAGSSSPAQRLAPGRAPRGFAQGLRSPGPARFRRPGDGRPPRRQARQSPHAHPGRRWAGSARTGPRPRRRPTRQHAPGSPPKAVLARRRDALRLNDLKRPKELRRDIAAILNDIAQREGLRASNGVPSRNGA